MLTRDTLNKPATAFQHRNDKTSNLFFIFLNTPSVLRALWNVICLRISRWWARVARNVPKVTMTTKGTLVFKKKKLLAYNDRLNAYLCGLLLESYENVLRKNERKISRIRSVWRKLWGNGWDDRIIHQITFTCGERITKKNWVYESNWTEFMRLKMSIK